MKLCIPTIIVPLLLIAVGCAQDSSHTVRGTMELVDKDASWVPGSSCEGSGGYDDIGSGTQVVVKDAKDEIIATGSLGPGTATTAIQCEFAFEIKDVPESDFYSIEVSHRGAITYSLEKMNLSDWEVGLTLGDDS